MSTEIDVLVDLPDGRTAYAGVLSETGRTVGRSYVSFEYSRMYLADPGAYALSPDLDLLGGRQSPLVHRKMFTGFEDALPDAWGRRLLHAQERRRARAEERSPRPLGEMDLLVGVPDLTRQGALRFRVDGQMQAPLGQDIRAFVDLSQLIQAATAFEKGAETDAILQVLLPGGTTQGGARPKATVRDAEGRLSIAKLPHPRDAWDVSAWEAVALDLADAAGIDTPEHNLQTFGDEHSVLTVRRFDRIGRDHRIGYMSAQTLMGRDDTTLIDYTDLVEEIASGSDRPTRDAQELFRRVALTLLINNNDDHMRNHGLLRTKSGWSLSPVFDVNPHPQQWVDGTPVSAQDDPFDRDIRLLLENASSFRLTRTHALEILTEVERASSQWTETARARGINTESILMMAGAFEGENRARAIALG